MRSTLIFKNIKVDNESTWEDSARALRKFISTELDMNYTDDKIDMFISRVHRDSEGSAKVIIKDQDLCLYSSPFFFFFFNWNSLHARLDSHYKA